MTGQTSEQVTVRPHRVRFDKCASCRSDARWMISGPTLGATTACDRHRATWERRADTRTRAGGEHDGGGRMTFDLTADCAECHVSSSACDDYPANCCSACRATGGCTHEASRTRAGGEG